MKGNIQRSTVNAQPPNAGRLFTSVLYWKLNVPCSLFLLLSARSLHSQTNALPALVPAYGELPPTFWESHQGTIIVAGFALIAFGFLFVKTLLRPENPKLLPPETIARQALTQLQSQPEDGHVLSAVSQLLRRFLSETFNLPHNELTTAEFGAAIQSNAQIGTELAQTISCFLRECDVRKFSPPQAATPLHAAGQALALVQLAEKRLAVVGLPATPGPSEVNDPPTTAPRQSPVP